MSRYFCIYQNILQKEISKSEVAKVKTKSASTECNGYNTCPQHTASSNGKYIKQSHCIGHRLKNKSTEGYDFPTTIIKGNLAEHDQYNTIFSLIQDEVNDRLKSPSYNKYRNNIENLGSNVPTLTTGNFISKDDINKLNNYIKNRVLYQDTILQPSFTNLEKNTIAKHDALQESMKAIQELMKDCICYSDCNGYSVCTCYGNCNHY